MNGGTRSVRGLGSRTRVPSLGGGVFVAGDCDSSVDVVAALFLSLLLLFVWMKMLLLLMTATESPFCSSNRVDENRCGGNDNDLHTLRLFPIFQPPRLVVISLPAFVGHPIV